MGDLLGSGLAVVLLEVYRFRTDFDSRQVQFLAASTYPCL